MKAVQDDDARNSEFQGDWASQPLSKSALFEAPQQVWLQLQTTYRTDFRAMVYGTLPSEAAVVAMLERISQGSSYCLNSVIKSRTYSLRAYSVAAGRLLLTGSAP